MTDKNNNTDNIIKFPEGQKREPVARTANPFTDSSGITHYTLDTFNLPKLTPEEEEMIEELRRS